MGIATYSDNQEIILFINRARELVEGKEFYTTILKK